MKNSEIAKLFEKIKSLGLFTNSQTHDKVHKKLTADPHGVDGAKFIATSGIPTGKSECRECRKNLPDEEFSYYQTRVRRDGTLMRSNALCNECNKKKNDERNAQLAGQKIPPKPARGSVCEKCRRPWEGTWHRDHDHKAGNFRRWLCGQCNMAQHDGRTPNPE